MKVTLCDKIQAPETYDGPNEPMLVVDHCLFFPHATKKGGFLYVQGWACHDRDHRMPARIELEYKGQHLGHMICDETRRDVQDIVKLNHSLGFGGHFYLDHRPKRNMSVDLLLIGPNGSLLRQTEEIFNVMRLNRTKELRNLSPLKKHKLNNLILNERERLSKEVDLKSKPLYLQLDPSFQCNLRCPYCHGNMMRREGLTLPQMKLEHARQILAEFGPSLIQVHLFNWGEPLLNENVHLFIEEAKKYEVWCSISSNLSLPLSDERIDQLILAGLDFLIMGNDGITQETYATYRKNGDVEMVLDNTRRFAERKRALGSKTPFLQFQFLDFPHNHHEIEEAQELAASLGVDQFFLKGGCVHHRPREWDLKASPSNAWVPMEADVRQNMLHWKDERENRGRYFGCDHLYHQLSINSDGSVHPCCYVFEPRHAIGKVGESGPAAFFNHKKMKAARQALRDVEQPDVGGYDPCANCWIVGDEESQGHKVSAINFLHALELLQDRPLDDLLFDPGPWYRNMLPSFRPQQV